MSAVKERSFGRLMIVVTALLWGLAGVCVKSVTWGAMSIVAVRSVISMIMLLIAKGSLRLKFTRSNIIAAVSMSVTGILYIYAITLTTAGTAIVLQYIAPILVYLYSVIFKKKKIKAAELVLTLAVFAGCVLSFADSLDFTRLLGNLLALASGFTFAAQIIFMNARQCDATDCSIISNGISILFCTPFMFFDPGLIFSLKNIVWVLIAGVFQYGLANIIFARNVQKVDRIEVALLLTIEPIFNPIPVLLLCGEKMSLTAVIGAAVVIISVAVYSMLPRLRKLRASRRS
ncbi:MAG: DMT family transporter [Lachnospiraceae bacterium]|jgi:drug/metabolite transporter (DMT)-like permease